MRRTNGRYLRGKANPPKSNSGSNKFFGCANRLSNPSEGHFIYYFSSYFLGNNKNIHYICTVVIEVLLGQWAILSYKKDVFERLSLWTTNFANSSNSHNRQMTTEASRGAFLYTILYSPYWRGLSALSILCGKGNAKACSPRMGKETDTYAFFVS